MKQLHFMQVMRMNPRGQPAILMCSILPEIDLFHVASFQVKCTWPHWDVGYSAFLLNPPSLVSNSTSLSILSPHFTDGETEVEWHVTLRPDAL